jgi:hypothetical protein
MDVRLVGDRVGALADGADSRSLLHDLTPQHGDGVELEQGDRVPVRGLDRECVAAVRDEADKRHRPSGGRDDRAARSGADVDPAVLAAGIGIVHEQERAEDRAGDRPGPGVRDRCGGERRDCDRGSEQSAHAPPAFVVVGEVPNDASGAAQSLCNDSR